MHLLPPFTVRPFRVRLGMVRGSPLKNPSSPSRGLITSDGLIVRSPSRPVPHLRKPIREHGEHRLPLSRHFAGNCSPCIPLYHDKHPVETCRRPTSQFIWFPTWVTQEAASTDTRRATELILHMPTCESSIWHPGFLAEPTTAFASLGGERLSNTAQAMLRASRESRRHAESIR